jgi:ankyrin repeat protein
MEEELHNAAAIDDVVTIRRLAAEGADVNVQGAEGVRPLHEAAHHGHVDASLVLVEVGADLEAATAGGLTPLHAAARRGHVTVVKTLIELRLTKRRLLLMERHRCTSRQVTGMWRL